jgi:hypothetical protein
MLNRSAALPGGIAPVPYRHDALLPVPPAADATAALLADPGALRQYLYDAAPPTALVASVSGGLDSDFAALWLRQCYPDHPIILWHAYLPEDWPQTAEHLLHLAARLGNCTVIRLQAVYELTGQATPAGYGGTRLRRIQDVERGGPAPNTDPAAITSLLDFWTGPRRGMPPTNSMRYCTAYFKTALFDAWVVRHRPELGARPLLVSGERWAESPTRARLPAWEARLPLRPTRAWPQGWQMTWLRPGIALPFHAVAGAVVAAGITPHPAYFLQGETLETLLDPTRVERGRARVSCRVCIFGQARHIRTALARSPETMAEIVAEVQAREAQTGRTWQQRGALLADIDSPPPRT